MRNEPNFAGSGLDGAARERVRSGLIAATATHKQWETGGRSSVHVPYWAVRLFNFQRSMGCASRSRSEDENIPSILAAPVTNDLLIPLYRTHLFDIIVGAAKLLKKRERFRKR